MTTDPEAIVTANKSTTTIRDAIATAIRDDVLDGRLSPGERLPEPLLAERFGVSRVPVREALAQLQSEGFVRLERFKGATVSGNSRVDTLDVLQVRRGLEGFGARLAAARKGGAHADTIRSIVTSSEEDTERTAHLAMTFHTVVAEASGNVELARTLSRTMRRVAWVFDRDVEVRSSPCWRDHTAIAGAILDGSPIQATYLMDEHVAKDEEFVRTLL